MRKDQITVIFNVIFPLVKIVVVISPNKLGKTIKGITVINKMIGFIPVADANIAWLLLQSLGFLKYGKIFLLLHAYI